MKKSRLIEKILIYLWDNNSPFYDALNNFLNPTFILPGMDLSPDPEINDPEGQLTRWLEYFNQIQIPPNEKIEQIPSLVGQILSHKRKKQPPKNTSHTSQQMTYASPSSINLNPNDSNGAIPDVISWLNNPHKRISDRPQSPPFPGQKKQPPTNTSHTSQEMTYPLLPEYSPISEASLHRLNEHPYTRELNRYGRKGIPPNIIDTYDPKTNLISYHSVANIENINALLAFVFNMFCRSLADDIKVKFEWQCIPRATLERTGNSLEYTVVWHYANEKPNFSTPLLPMIKKEGLPYHFLTRLSDDFVLMCIHDLSLNALLQSDSPITLLKSISKNPLILDLQQDFKKNNQTLLNALPTPLPQLPPDALFNGILSDFTGSDITTQITSVSIAPFSLASTLDDLRPL